MKEQPLPAPDDFPDSQLGAEAAVPQLTGEVTARQYSRLKAFEHILQQVDQYQPIVDRGIDTRWGIVNAEGKIAETHLVIDQALLFRLRKMAHGIYESDLANQPITKDIARDIVYDSKEHPAPMPEHTFSKLWETE